MLDAEGAETGMFEVPAGGRRFRALELLVKQKRMAKTQLVPCVVREGGLAEEDSLAENVQRAALHPLDQFRAFQALCDKGLSEEDIVARFFVNPRLIVIDTLARIRPASKASESLYSNDYAAIQPLQELAGRHNISIIVVHHTRKSEADDPFDTISGSLGLTGSADNLWVLAKQGEITRLVGRGRDLEDFDKAVKFLPMAGAWEISGDAGSLARTQERQTVLDAIREAGEPIGARDIAAETGGREGNIRRLLPKLVKEGLVEKVSYGKYCIPGNTGNTGNTLEESGGNADIFEGKSVTGSPPGGNTSAVAIRRMLEPVEKEAAKERQGTRTDQHPGNFPESDKGRVRDKVAAFTGVSGRTLDKADALVAAAEAEPQAQSVTGVTASVTGTPPAKPRKQPSVTSVTGNRPDGSNRNDHD